MATAESRQTTVLLHDHAPGGPAAELGCSYAWRCPLYDYQVSAGILHLLFSRAIATFEVFFEVP